MPKHKVSELEGPLLDLAVAMAEGVTQARLSTSPFPDEPKTCFFWESVYDERDNKLHCSGDKWSPSTDWAQGGPLIERHWITVSVWPDGIWSAYGLDNIQLYGPTPLIAAMRCYVASKYGEEIELPDLSA